MRWGTDHKLIVGKYSSIGPDVSIILGGNHRHDWVTTSQLPAETFQAYEKFPKAKSIKNFIYSKGDIIIGNDVWIGNSVTIMSGVKIGDGAVIACNSHIVKDVEPYTIAGGNPGQAIKKRFSDEQIKKLLKIKWWDWDVQKINDNTPLLCNDNIDYFINKHYIE